MIAEDETKRLHGFREMLRSEDKVIFDASMQTLRFTRQHNDLSRQRSTLDNVHAVWTTQTATETGTTTHGIRSEMKKCPKCNGDMFLRYRKRAWVCLDCDRRYSENEIAQLQG